ncbi:protoporphyrinogen oxidase HemJ [Bosea vaviloviae]
MAMYEWIKAFHVMAVIAWMASMLYLPRLMVYHAEAQTGSIQSETFKIMERRLLKGIMTPSMIVTWILGLYLAWSAFGFKGGWLHGKILLVFILSAIHGYLAGRVRAFAEDRNLKSARFYRVINEVPAVLMALIVILVIVKPF